MRRCLPCSTDEYCLQGASHASGVCPSAAGVDCSSGVLTILPGYWSPPLISGSIDALDSNQSLSVYKCQSIDACVGGSVTQSQLMVPNVCGDGYVGDLCSGCAAGWANTGGGKCVRCHSPGVLIFSLLLVPTVVLMILAVLVSVITHKPAQKSQASAHCGA